MATKVKSLTTLMGDYGKAVKGDQLIVRDKTAKELEKKGLVEIVGESKEDEQADDFSELNVTAQKAGAKEAAEKTTSITDNTKKTATGAEEETDPKNATGKATTKTATKKGK